MNRQKIGTMVMTLMVTALFLPLMAGGQEAGEDPPPQRQPRRQMLTRDILDITPEQQEKIEAFRKARNDANTAFRDLMAGIRGELRELMKAPATNEAAIGGLIDKMYKLQADRAKEAFETHREWQSIFTSEQLEKMKNDRAAFSRSSRLNRGRARALLGRIRAGSSRLGWGRRLDSRFMGPRFGRFDRFGPRRGPGFNLWRPLDWRRH